MLSEEQLTMLRQFYEDLASIKDKLEQSGVPEEQVETALEGTEQLIIAAMEHAEEEDSDDLGDE